MSPRRTSQQGRRKLGRPARLTPDIQSIIAELEKFLSITDEQNRIVCSAACGVYAFYDYDDEPIYVGQTHEGLRIRIRRHLTNQRTDAVAMHVLDPMEVARVEVWPFWDLAGETKPWQREVLQAAEYAIFQRLTSQARISALLNEKPPAPSPIVDLPQSFSAGIVPEEVRERLAHADERIARRAATIADLSQVIRERDVSLGLRQTLVTQAERLEHLAKRRLDEVAGENPPAMGAEETRRAGSEDAEG